MPKRKANSRSKPGAQERHSHKKSSAESSPPPLPLNNACSTAPAAVPLSSNADELSRTQAALKALQDRFAEEKKTLQTQNKQLQSRNEHLNVRLVEQEQNSKAVIKGLLFEVDELKTELAVFRCASITNLSL